MVGGTEKQKEATAIKWNVFVATINAISSFCCCCCFFVVVFIVVVFIDVVIIDVVIIDILLSSPLQFYMVFKEITRKSSISYYIVLKGYFWIFQLSTFSTDPESDEPMNTIFYGSLSIMKKVRGSFTSQCKLALAQ